MNEEEAGAEGILPVPEVKGDQRPSSSPSSCPSSSSSSSSSPSSSSFCRLVAVPRVEEEASRRAADVAQDGHVVEEQRKPHLQGEGKGGRKSRNDHYDECMDLPRAGICMPPASPALYLSFPPPQSFPPCPAPFASPPPPPYLMHALLGHGGGVHLKRYVNAGVERRQGGKGKHVGPAVGLPVGLVVGVLHVALRGAFLEVAAGPARLLLLRHLLGSRGRR